MNIEQGAVAKLVMQKGSLVSEVELRDKIMAYGYIEDDQDSFAFNLLDYQGYISFDRDGEIFNIYAEREIDIIEHAQNLDNVLIKAGWIEFDLYAVNENVANELTRTIGLELRDIKIGDEVRTDSGSRNVSADQLDEVVGNSLPSTDTDTFGNDDLQSAGLSDELDSSLRGGSDTMGSDSDMIGGDSDLIEAHARIQELEMEIGTVRAESERLSSALVAAQETIRQLRAAPKAAGAVTVPSASRQTLEQPASTLHAVVESHLAKLIDFDASCAGEGASLIRELRDAGYVLQVRLTEPVA